MFLIKKWFAYFGMATCILSLSACNSTSSANSDIIVQSKAGEITKEEFYKELKTQGDDQVLKQMVDTMLLEQKYKVTDQEIDKKIKEYEKQFGGKVALKQALEQKGIKGEEAFKKLIKQELLAEKAATDGVKISQEDIKSEFVDKYRVEIKASHILVADEKTAKEVKAKLDKGDDFAKLAKEYSKDPGSKDKGGNLGYFTKGKMVPEFDKVVFTMDVGKISEPVKTQFGYHIIKVTDKKTNKFDDKKEEIEKELKFKKAKSVDQVIPKLQKEADINIKDKDFSERGLVKKSV
ncbi:peptidylprolyl isomerase [Bacillus subtilis]|uniref:Foldase protein PrsA n=1 Tax=Bacillus subtilis subsp. subtilis TaxID=135461 RepID=A0ABD3ZSA0_BACIU|nr:peptidylprolyl isomerase [Bacillus subtilis]KIL30595.1 Foldase protein PrsA precursor [Bacillus subtilis subsp. subtilis]KIN46381.1 Foldase protein PrsA precursor [Bacillus subtilis]WCL63786.1 peptidylprolyl isomerase [Bacillus subtilis]